MNVKKKTAVIFCVALVVAMAIPAIAAAPVYHNMTDTELWENYAELTGEMVSRGLISEWDVALPSGSASQENISRTNTTKTYVLNTNTHKIHMPNCSSVLDMKEKNKEIVHGDINTWLSKGYDKCKKCNPK